MSRHSSSPEPTGAPSLPARLDPRGGRATGGRRGGGAPAPETGGKRMRLRAARGLCALVSVVVLGLSGWAWYLSQVVQSSVSRMDVIADGSKHSGPMNLLLVGTDSRTSLSAAERKLLHTGGNSGMNTDTMILVHVPSDGSRASFVSFPRDSWVQIPGHGWGKLNAAYADGYVGASGPESQRQAAGARSLIQTIQGLSGLTIDHYAEVDLLGFYNLSSVVGGVEVNLCAPVDDHYSGANFPAGPQTISGANALKFVRQRHGLPRGDFDRIVRQQVFLGGVVRKMLSQKVMLDPGKQRQLVQAVAGSLSIDRSLDLMSLGQQMQSVTAGKIKFQTVPNLGTGRSPDGRLSIVQLADADTVHAFFANLSADPTTGKTTGKTTGPATARTVAPNQVKVAVLNGSGTTGLAAQTQTELESAGFVVASTGNADSSNYATSEIRYAAGDDELANTLAAAVPGAAMKQVQGVPAGTVQLILGKNFTGVGKPAGAGALASPSLAPAAATSPAGDESSRTAADTSCIN